MITRRQFLITMVAGLQLAPLTADAQQPKKMARIGNLSLDAKRGPREENLTHALRDLGWIEGENIAIEYRWAARNVDRLQTLANELVGLKVDLIVAWGTVVVQAVKNATSTIPVVMGATADPVGSGLVASLARPGRNITGSSLMAPGLAGKRLELLKEAVPRLTRVVFLAHGGDPAHKLFVKEAEDAGRSLGLQVRPLVVKGPEELEKAFSTIVNERAGALIVQPVLASSSGEGPRIAQLAISNQLPTISDGYQFAEVGGLMYYGPDRVALDRRIATYVDKILRGAKPSDLPVEQPTKFELLINRKTAKALGITIPQELLLRADKVIE